MRQSVRHLLATTCIASAMLGGIVWSAFGAPPPKTASVQGTRQNGYSRIVFKWPDDVNISARVDGNRLAMTFNRKAKFDFAGLKASLPGIVERAEMTPDGRTVLLTLDQPYRIRTFTSDRMAGVDLLAPAPQQAAAEKPASTQAPSVRAQADPDAITSDEELEKFSENSVPAAPAAAPVKAAPVKKPAKIAAKAGTKTKAATAKPAAKTKTAAKKMPAPAKTAAAAPAKKKPKIAAKNPSPATVAAAGTAPASKAVKPQVSALASLSPAAGQEPPPAAPAASPAESAPQLAPAAQVPQEASPAAGPVKRTAATVLPEEAENVLSIVPSIGKEGVVLRFAFQDRTACAVFKRAGYVWIVFNRPVGVYLDLLENQLSNQTGPAERVPDPNATVLRIPVDGQSGATITRDAENFSWQIALASSPQPTTTILPVEVHTEPPVKPYLLVPALETGNAITVTDPSVGDELVILPSYKPGEGIMPAREFIDFALLESAQGVVVQKITDDTLVMSTRGGIRVSTRQGAQLTPGLPQPETPVNTAEMDINNTLFPYEAWKPGNENAFDFEVRKLFHEMAMAKTPADKNGLRLRLASVYLGQGMGVEALGMLDEIRRTDPSFYITHKLNALSGASNFLMERYGDASQNFAALELNSVPEARFWRDLTAELLGSTEQHFDYLAAYPFIKQYPPVMRQRLGIVAADRSIAAQDYNKAMKIIDTLQEPDIIDPIKPYVNFLLGKISAGTGQIDAALEVWRPLSENYANPFVRASAEFSLITQELKSGGIQMVEAIKRLERLRIAWRGDSLELSVLMLLGRLYDDQEDYANALNAWRDIVIVFPNTEQASEVSRYMQRAFLTLFNKGASDKMALLDALSLFYEYRDLTPVGTDGDTVIHQLADKLIGMDLLEQAALLLDQQMRTRQQKEARSRTGAKLATVYLLNQQPEKALQALELSAYGDNPTDLNLTRDRLAAQALTETGRYDEALTLLAHDDSVEADGLRVHIYWKRKDWAKLIETGETSLKKRKDPTATLTENESGLLLKLALAYIFEKDEVQLQYLHDYFGPLMAQSPNKPMFDVLTQPNIAPDPRHFEQAMQQVESTRSFLESFRTHSEATAN